MANFDLEKTTEVAKLFEVKERDEWWRNQFFAAIPEASMKASSPQVSRGPDGFPYFQLTLPQNRESFETFCVNHILDNCVQHGVGIAVFSAPEKVEWVFSYGDVWSFKTRGKFYVPAPEIKTGTETLTEERRVMVGQPSEERLPSVVRGHLRRYWQAVLPNKEIKMLMMSEPNGAQSIVFDLKPADFPSQDQMSQALTMARWFMPNDLSIVSLGDSPQMASHYSAL